MEVMKTLHVAPQQRSAVIQVELKDILKGNKIQDRWRASEDIDSLNIPNKHII